MHIKQSLSLKLKKGMKKKGDKAHVNCKGYDNSFNSWIDKMYSLYNMSCYPDPYSHRRNKIKVELDLSNYATKSEVEKVTGVATSKLS